jgi:acyl-CoA thioester hydrolase
MERARTELLRSLGLEQDRLLQEPGIIFVVHSVSIKYLKPARFNDELNVVTSVLSLGKASIRFKQTVYLDSVRQANNKDDGVLADADITIACLNAKKFKAQSIPATIITKINQEFHCGS